MTATERERRLFVDFLNMLVKLSWLVVFRIFGDDDLGLDAVVLRLLDAVSLRVDAVVLRVQRGACWWTSWSCC